MDMLSKNLNPFKRKQNAPVVYWSGIMETGPEKRSVTYKIPDYFNGSLKVMAVSVSKDRIGTANVSTLARNTFIIMPNIPLAAAPGDEFDVSVTVTNNRKGSGPKNNVELKIEPTSNLEIVGDSTIKMTIPEGIKVELPKNTQIIVTGIDKQLVGEFAANVRKIRQPEPYLGKGIKYDDEVIRRKEGKTAKK